MNGGRKIIDKEYKKIEFICGTSIEEAVLKLVSRGVKGEFVCADFNGHTLYSDMVSIDSAYKEITGDTYFEVLHKREISRERARREEEEYQKKVPELVQQWIDKGHEVLDQKYWSKWDEIVPIRLKDLYHGMELKASLEIIKPLNEGYGLNEAKEIIDNQGHSVMSFGLVRAIVKEFCERGSEFSDSLN